MPSGRDTVDRWIRALGQDVPAALELLHPDFVEEWPQSGERIRGPENLRAVIEGYPGLENEGATIGTVEVRDIVGSEDEWVLGPTFTPLQIAGTGDTYTAESRGRYPDGSEWMVVHIIKLKDDKVFRATTYFCQPFEAPEWRRPFVERME